MVGSQWKSVSKKSFVKKEKKNLSRAVLAALCVAKAEYVNEMSFKSV